MTQTKPSQIGLKQTILKEFDEFLQNQKLRKATSSSRFITIEDFSTVDPLLLDVYYEWIKDLSKLVSWRNSIYLYETNGILQINTTDSGANNIARFYSALIPTLKQQKEN